MVKINLDSSGSSDRSHGNKTREELQKEQAENKRELEVEEAIQKDLPKDHPNKSSRYADELRKEIEILESKLVR